MKLLQRDTIKAYIHEEYIFLEQESLHGDDPKVIAMLPDDIPKIVEWLNHLAEELLTASPKVD